MAQNGHSIYKYLSYGAQHPGWDTVYGNMSSRCYGVVHVYWTVDGNQFTVTSVSAGNEMYGPWPDGWYRGGVQMDLDAGGGRVNVIANAYGSVAATQRTVNKYGIGETGPVWDTVANQQLPKTWTINQVNTPFTVWFGGTWPPYAPGNNGGFTVGDLAPLEWIGGDRLDVIPVVVEYFPCAISQSSWKSCNRQGGSFTRRTNGQWADAKCKMGAPNESHAFISRSNWEIAPKVGAE